MGMPGMGMPGMGMGMPEQGIQQEQSAPMAPEQAMLQEQGAPMAPEQAMLQEQGAPMAPEQAMLQEQTQNMVGGQNEDKKFFFFERREPKSKVQKYIYPNNNPFIIKDKKVNLNPKKHNSIKPTEKKESSVVFKNKIMLNLLHLPT